MDQRAYANHLHILKQELRVALGCTEPIAIAYAGAKAREVLGEMPEHCRIHCSGNIVKNVKGVVVPNSGGLRGIEVAVLLGIVGGVPDRELAVLEEITDAHRETVRTLLAKKICDCSLLEGVENLHIIVEVTAGDRSAMVEIQESHSNITRILKDGKTLFAKEQLADAADSSTVDKGQLSLRSILEFADTFALADLKEELFRQISYNTTISEEGLQGNWGVQAGKTLLAGEAQPSLRLRARAAAAAGSDARMGGCALPVVINSGSGNQGITVVLPIVTYAKEYGCSEESSYRALALANLLAIHQKKYIGALSAYCGVVSAATASACGIAYLLLREKLSLEELYRVMSDTITNSLCTIGGMVCDGAKSSCATKISMAVENALSALELAMQQRVLQPGEGLVMEEVEDTIRAIGRMGKDGMRTTDVEILNMMLGK